MVAIAQPIEHEDMCSISPLAVDYNPFLLCTPCANTILEMGAITWFEEQEARHSAILRRQGIASWLTAMPRRFPNIRVAFGGR